LPKTWKSGPPPERRTRASRGEAASTGGFLHVSPIEKRNGAPGATRPQDHVGKQMSGWLKRKLNRTPGNEHEDEWEAA